MTTDLDDLDLGTPPRVWGLPTTLPARSWHRRYTPTRVGTSSLPPRGRPSPSVHPHACGDFSAAVAGMHGRRGTPPRVWGLLRLLLETGDSLRYTPTRVGTSSRHRSMARIPTVHPHACGDFVPDDLDAAAPDGTPPRVWGLLKNRLKKATALRYTPTRVGTSPDSRAPHRISPVHPHACGDFRHPPPPYVFNDGTPPRVWGLLSDG